MADADEKSDVRQISYQLTLDDRTPEQFEVVDFQVREALFDGCTVTVRAASAELFDGRELLGKDGHLCLLLGEEEPRWFNGVVFRCVLQKTPSDGNLLQVEIRSRLALLALGGDNRIFTDAGEKKVVDEVLDQAGIAKDAREWNLGQDPPDKPHILQRQESDLAFMQRLLARTGIGYAVHNTEKAEKIVFFDDSSALPPIDGEATLADRRSSPTGFDVVYQLREAARVRPDTVMMRDYNPLLPGANLDVHAPAGGGGAREVYLHPDEYNDVSVGKRLAQRALEAADLARHSIRGQSGCPRLEPGRRFTVSGHPRDVLNHEYVLVDVMHQGHVTVTEDGRHVAYENSFSALRKEVPFRPPLREPLRAGCEIGFVTCPPGEEIHVDQFGRAKVRFPWDRSGRTDDKSSAWLRVGQLALGGSMILPRGDFEVIIDFELGEVDRPYIAGHLYNGKSPPPYALPAGATCSSVQTNTTSKGGGANEVRFEDAAGSEEILLNASKDLTISVDNDASYSVANNETCKVGSNTELNVGTDHIAAVVANRKLQIGATQSVNVTGDFSGSVGGDAQVQVGAARKVQCGGDHGEKTIGTLSRTVGALQSVTGLKGIGRDIVGSSQVSVGAAWMEVVGRSRSSNVSGSRQETIGALKLIRAKQVSLSCGGSLTINGAAEVVSCGGSRVDSAEGAVAVTTGGGLSIKAKNITIEAKESLALILGGCVVQLAKGGKILIKAANVDLKGAKSLGQVMHESN